VTPNHFPSTVNSSLLSINQKWWPMSSIWSNQWLVTCCPTSQQTMAVPTHCCIWLWQVLNWNCGCWCNATASVVSCVKTSNVSNQCNLWDCGERDFHLKFVFQLSPNKSHLDAKFVAAGCSLCFRLHTRKCLKAVASTIFQQTSIGGEFIIFKQDQLFCACHCMGLCCLLLLWCNGVNWCSKSQLRLFTLPKSAPWFLQIVTAASMMKN